MTVVDSINSRAELTNETFSLHVASASTAVIAPGFTGQCQVLNSAAKALEKIVQLLGGTISPNLVLIDEMRTALAIASNSSSLIGRLGPTALEAVGEIPYVYRQPISELIATVCTKDSDERY